jgi:hypothetical protein
MSVQYAAGTKINNTFSGVTKADMLANTLSGLTTAGWTLVNGITPSVVTITIASPAVVTLTAHGLAANTRVVLNTTGALPSGLSTNTTYFVVSPTTNTFSLSATSGGSAIATSLSQSGVHTLSSEILMQCATTPQSYSLRCRFRDNTGTSVQYSIETSDGVKVGTNSTSAGGHLTPGNGKTWHLCANKHQFAMWVHGDYTTGNEFVLVSCPFVFSFLAPTYIGFMISSSRNDTDTSGSRNGNWRYGLREGYADGNYGSSQVLYNTTLLDYTANTGTGSGNGRGWPGIISGVYAGNSSNFQPNGLLMLYRWGNGDATTMDAILTWGLTSITDEPMMTCQLWDAIVIGDQFFGDTTTSFDSHNWIAVTSSITSGQYGTLFMVTP